MTREQIENAFSEKYPDWTLTEISFTPWGAYIYAFSPNSATQYSFTIDF